MRTKRRDHSADGFHYLLSWTSVLPVAVEWEKTLQRWRNWISFVSLDAAQRRTASDIPIVGIVLTAPHEQANSTKDPIKFIALPFNGSSYTCKSMNNTINLKSKQNWIIQTDRDAWRSFVSLLVLILVRRKRKKNRSTRRSNNFFKYLSYT